MTYIKFKNKVGRIHSNGDSKLYSTKEWYINGEWVEDADMSLDFNDAMMDFGGWSLSDYENLTESEAMKLIKAIK